VLALAELRSEALSVQLSARIDYAGKTITEEDLENLDLDPDKVDLDLLNSFQSDADLDELAKRNGVFRDPGSFATGTVTFQTTSDSVTIPKGTVVGTQPDADGDYLAFERRGRPARRERERDDWRRGRGVQQRAPGTCEGLPHHHQRRRDERRP
jgi:hypothetical protein